ncbi:homeobox-like domain superfamily [Holotrichia oblita]|uniref:Homeobox-like domain superfamily n=1 Tax=Holotrichia oblita TaxID=644536 RepID=A0ACB9TS86_HOLOL|nr:homeobox-like domain superfamily [Holotrichia oblita]
MSQAKRKRAETSRDPNIWLQWLNELSDEEKDYDDESDDEEEHENQDKTSEHDSDSLQECSETEEHLSDEEEEGVHQNNNYFVAVDKKNNGEIKWSKEVPNPTRTRSHNIILHLPGSKGDARNAKSETDCLKLFISDSVISMITESTNIYIQEQQHNYGRDRDCRKIDEREIRAYIVRAVALIQDGRSQYYVARELGVSRCKVQRAVKRFNEFGVYTRRNHCGRQKSTSERDNRFITLNVLRDRKVTSVQMKNRLENVRQVQVLLRFFFSFQIPGPCRYIPDTTIRYNSLRAPGQTNTSSEQRALSAFRCICTGTIDIKKKTKKEIKFYTPYLLTEGLADPCS